MPDDARKAMYQKLGKSHVDLQLLNQYYVMADRMRVHFEAALQKPTPSHIKVPLIGEPEKWIYLCYWYGGAYVVIEAWLELKISDPRIDPLLQDDECLQTLRRFRNGVFHFQRKVLDDRFVEFIALQHSVKWLRTLWAAIGTYIIEQLRPTPAVVAGS